MKNERDITDIEYLMSKIELLIADCELQTADFFQSID
jgi:hypothetical protein